MHQNPSPQELLNGLQEHLDYRLSLNSISEGSVSSYKSDITQALQFMIASGLDFSSKTIELYAQSLSKRSEGFKPYARMSIARKKSSCSAYLGVQIRRKIISLDESYKDYLRTKRSDKTPDHPHLPLTLEEVDLLISYAATLDLRGQLEILLLVTLGTRAEETVELKVKNFLFVNGNVDLLKTKGTKRRQVPLPDFVEAILKEYIAKYELGYDDYIFPRNSKNKELGMTRKTLTSHINKAALEAKILRPCTPHCLRSTFANLLYYYGKIDINSLQEILGHEDITTTMKYVGKKHSTKELTLTEIFAKWAQLLRPSETFETITSDFLYRPRIRVVSRN